MKYLYLLLLIFFSFSAYANLPLHTIKLPPGFKIELLAQVPSAREMSISPAGNIYVGSMDAGKIYVVQRENLKTKEVLTLVSGLNKPVGVSFHDGDLYFSAINKIFKLPKIESQLHTAPQPQPQLVYDKFPTDEHHGWKYLAFGPDGKLYVPVGAPCNICSRGSRYANITRMNANGSAREVVAEGIRNTVGFAWHPVTKELWFTDNGRDLLGDDVPPDELNRVAEKGGHFGFPFCHGNGIADPEFGKGKKCTDFSAPAQVLGPHVAALGMKFYTGTMFPGEYKNKIFIAEHGSWNRTKKLGYRVSLVKLDSTGKRALSYAPFAEGWLQEEKAWGRPVDVAVDLDGALLVSDDLAGAIYRISFQQPK